MSLKEEDYCVYASGKLLLNNLNTMDHKLDRSSFASFSLFFLAVLGCIHRRHIPLKIFVIYSQIIFVDNLFFFFF